MRSRDPEEMEEPTLRGSKELYFITLSHLETPAQRKPCGYKEGKCNRCNRMQQRLHCFACFNERCLLSRLSFSFGFHSLFPFSSAFPSFLFACQQTASNGQQRSFIFVSLVSGFQRAFTQLGTATRQQTSRDRSRETRQRAATAFSHSHTRRYILQA